MGMFDSVYVECPQCEVENEFQSKGGECLLSDYTLDDCPKDVLSDVNRHSPHTCYKCQTEYIVDIETRKSVQIKSQ